MLWSKWQQENVSGDDFESQASDIQHRASNRKIGSQSLRQTVGGSPARPFGKWQNHSESVNGVWLLFSLQSAKLSPD